MTRYWTVKEIAEFLGLGERHTRDRVVKHPEFPKRVNIRLRLQKWDPEAVKAWSLGKKK